MPPAVAEAIPRAVAVHALPGRVRLRIPARRDDAAWFGLLAERLAGYPEVTAVTVSPASAGVLVQYRGDLADLAARTERDGYFRLEQLAVQPPDAAAELKGKMAAFGRWVDLTTGDGGALPAVLFVLLAVGGLVQLARGKVLAPAVTLFWYAATLALAARTAQAVTARRTSADTGRR